MKRCLAFALCSLFALLFLNGCATNHDQSQAMSRTGTPSPLNTSANPWTNVNPQIQAQQQTARAIAR